MNRATRAIIMAAGKGERMHPVTLSTPKPLIRVNGVRMIDTIIRGLQVNGIDKIYVVVGYLKEQFHCLTQEYNNIILIENPYYETCNNISSLYVARDYIENSIILDGDQIILDPMVLSAEFEHSGYRCVWTDTLTREWLLTLNNNRVSSCSRIGGQQGWQLYSISYWNSKDGRKLMKHLEVEFGQNDNRNIFWDDVPLFCYPKDYELSIYPMSRSAVVELDNFEELLKADPSYTNYKEHIS